MHTPTHTSQTGAALITGLIFLVALTLISLSAIKSTSLEERMAGNARDRDVAFQAAEAGIREAMRLVVPTLSPVNFPATGCAAGLCANNVTTPVWTTITNNNEWTSTKTKAYVGTALTFDGSTGVYAQPRYIIELIPQSLPPPGSSLAVGKGNPASQPTPYRVTARGWGITSQSQATVQAAINY